VTKLDITPQLRVRLLLLLLLLPPPPPPLANTCK
jgi:hypothetical protein